MRSRYCKTCGDWHDMDQPWPEACVRVTRTSGIQIIKDIEPYQAMGADVASGNKAPRIGSRREHREYLKRNDYVEVGNERPKPKPVNYGPEVTPREVRQAFEQLRDSRR